MSAKYFFALLRHLLVLMPLALATMPSQAQVSSENQLKAAFLVNFLKYVEFPPKTGAAATICLFGRDTLGGYLSGFEGRLIGGRELRVKRINSPEQVADCQLLFIPDTEEARFAITLRWVANSPVLTVSDAEIFTRQGGGIALFRADGRLQFDINIEALSSAGLKPSSQIIRLARQVIGVAK